MKYIALLLFLLIIIIGSVFLYKKIYDHFKKVYGNITNISENTKKIYEGFNDINNENSKNTNIVLLGDSIFNNSSYTSNGKSVSDLLIENNTFVGLTGGFVAPICYGATPVNAMLRGNTFNSPANSIKITSGTLFLDQNRTISGSPDYGTATVKTATYA